MLRRIYAFVKSGLLVVASSSLLHVTYAAPRKTPLITPLGTNTVYSDLSAPGKTESCEAVHPKGAVQMERAQPVRVYKGNITSVRLVLILHCSIYNSS